jgi:hypothetical protein
MPQEKQQSVKASAPEVIAFTVRAPGAMWEALKIISAKRRTTLNEVTIAALDHFIKTAQKAA